MFHFCMIMIVYIYIFRYSVSKSQPTALRKWIALLDNHMPSETKRALKEAAAGAGVEMVKKTVDKEGRTRVSKT